MAAAEQGAIRFAEKMLTLLDEGQFTATYKFAVLLGLLDLALENVDRHGEPPTSFTTRQLAENVIELYWPHTVPYGMKRGSTVLKQNAGRSGSQAEIVRQIERFRERTAGIDPSGSLVRLRRRAEVPYARLCDAVEWKLIEMPLPRVQIVGNLEDRFIYEIGWGMDVRPTVVRAYQRGEGGTFDNRILLKPGVGEYLIQLNGLLRPMVHRQWAAMVAQLNGFDETRLERFLFGASRTVLEGLRPGLRDLQDNVCFYCRRAMREAGEVDHFIPWSRYPEDGLANLVLAHGRCNQHKRDFLAAVRHVERWHERAEREALVELAAQLKWDASVDEMLGVARATYLRLPGDAVLWVEGKQFERADARSLKNLLA